MGRVLIGTASWTDKTLLSAGFYPSEAGSAEARLRYYASVFPIVEVDSTYYFPPTERNSVLWIERTPEDFIFHIKSYSLFTLHPTRPNSIHKDLQPLIPESESSKRSLYAGNLPMELVDEMWRRFVAALMPLHSAGKLGMVHMQFPEWFMPGSESRNHIVDCRERLHDFDMAIEFRNERWLEPKTIERTSKLLADHQIAFTNVDMPQGFKSSLPPTAITTHPRYSYVRFHGRNTENWKKQWDTATPRFAYLYSEKELEEWVPRIRKLAEKTEQVHVLMNNCYRDYAVNNAQQLADML